jgi:hypothetical protein
LAYWHHPLFSSGKHGNNPGVEPLYRALYDADAELILSGHDHHYERFAPQDPDGGADPVRGIRQFVVGSGGKNHYSIGTVKPNSQVRNTDTFGVLKLVLEPTGYRWEFLPVAGRTFTDGGSETCHDEGGTVARGEGRGTASLARTGGPAGASGGASGVGTIGSGGKEGPGAAGMAPAEATRPVAWDVDHVGRRRPDGLAGDGRRLEGSRRRHTGTSIRGSAGRRGVT